jgi:hypothetical protein
VKLALQAARAGGVSKSQVSFPSTVFDGLIWFGSVLVFQLPSVSAHREGLALWMEWNGMVAR